MRGSIARRRAYVSNRRRIGLRGYTLAVCAAAALPVGAAHAAKANPANPASPAVSTVDDSGNTITLAAPAQRVISLSPHATELIYAAGGGAKLVGAVAYSDYPPQALSVPRVGDNRALDLERIAALKPDLIVVWRHGNAQQQIDRLREMHIPLFFSQPHRLDDVATSLTRLGVLLGTQNTAQDAADAYRRQIAQLRARYAQRAPVKVFYEVWDQPLMTINGEHMISDVIALCGGRNVFAALRPLVPTLSTEAVLAANPDAIVAASPGASAPDRPLPALAHWRAWPQLHAVARGNLFAIDGDLLTRPGPRIAQGAARLCEDLDRARSRDAGANTGANASATN
ncbi:cobalamin-binding protein [Paraburkholderia tagetis]|uniref:Cobalamin-binding protein n=1 Tax=Paraburkholderia tagetis TaxID=2913261 RepID=A0A9X1UIJ6_9BURK|nr:cobalamin-binding protein [Paraburkholderia tagetis]MCG5075323.1 cobalamin-binding protein [Paraburkholderia tagetis]